MVKDAKHARQMTGQQPKEKTDVRSKRVQAIYAILKEKYEYFSHNTAGAEAFVGKAGDSAILQGAYDEITESKALNSKTEESLRKVFMRMKWTFPATSEEIDNSRVFGPKHGWRRELKRRLAELKAGSGHGGTPMIEIGPADAAYLAGVKRRLDEGGVSDAVLQKAYRVLKKYETGI